MYSMCRDDSMTAVRFNDSRAHVNEVKMTMMGPCTRYPAPQLLTTQLLLKPEQNNDCQQEKVHLIRREHQCPDIQNGTASATKKVPRTPNGAKYFLS